MHVVFIHNRDAEDIAKIIESFAKPTPAASASARRPQALASPGVGAELTGRDFGLTVDPPTRSLVVRADPETFELIRKLVDQLDKIPPRVSVEVAIMEISRPAGFQLGINLFVPLNVPEDRTDPISFFRSPTGGESLIPGPASASSASQLFAGYARNPIQLTLTDASGATIPFTVPQASASIEAGEQSVETSLLIRPQLVVLSGEEHEIFVGNNVPVPVAANTQQAGGEQVAAPGFLPSQTVRQNIERVDIGVGLRIRPLVGEQGVVLLEVDLEISDTTESLAGDTKRVGPTFIRQNIHSTLRLNSARHAVIGAYTGQSVSGRRSGVPFLMDIPVLGYFFSQVSKQRMDNSVVAIVSARVLRTHEEDIAESIRRRLAFERSISRTFDVRRLSDAPYAVLLETTSSELLARRIALGFEDDGYPTRVTEWALDGESRWDVYLTEIESFEAAGDLANQLLGADWNPRITVLAAENEFAIE
jgi:type II secretory pathway component GspD/PulD (secretin)